MLIEYKINMYKCFLFFSLPSKSELSHLSYIKASPPMQPVTASPKGDLSTGVLLYMKIAQTSWTLPDQGQGHSAAFSLFTTIQTDNFHISALVLNRKF